MVQIIRQRHIDVFFAVTVTILVFMVNRADAFVPMHFEPYKPLDTYKCGEFMASAINDPAMRLFYRFNNAVIRLLSRPFPHEKLLSKAAIQGDINAWAVSFEKNYMTWIDFERNWLGACVILVALSIVFMLAYFLYRCCACCCSLRHSRSKKSRISERRFDGCQRVLFDIIISAFIIVNLFASVVLLMSTQYAQFGIEELPSRLNYCVNDFSVYKFENNDRIRKLLRDDFQVLNTTLVKNVDSLGEEVVKKFKYITGAFLLDELIEHLNGVQALQEEAEQLRQNLTYTQSVKLIVRNKLHKLQESEATLRKCTGVVLDDVPMPQAQTIRESTPAEKSDDIFDVQHSQKPQGAFSTAQAQTAVVDIASVRVCHTALHIMQPLIYGEYESADYVNEVLPPKIGDALAAMPVPDILHHARPVQKSLDQLKAEIQNLVTQLRPDIINRLKLLDDTMFNLFEEISSGIKSIDLRHLEDIVNPMMEQRERLKTYIQYSWITMLIITGIFMFVACSFLLGLFFGCCGRRPSLYDDDCCVRSTGGKFYGCGIWLCMAFIVFFSIITAGLIFVGSNISHLICHPLEDPLARPDMLSLLDRVLDAYGLENNNHLARYNLPQILTPERRPADLLRGCSNGETFYAMLGLDRKFRFLGEGGPMEEYMELADSVKVHGLGRTLDQHVQLEFDAAALSSAIQRLPESSPPMLDDGIIRQFQAAGIHYDIEAALHQLKKVLAEKLSDNNGVKNEATSAGVAEVTVIIRYLENLQSEAPFVKLRIDENTQNLHQLNKKLDELAAFSKAVDGSTWSKRLEDATRALGLDSRAQLLDQAVEKTVNELTDVILQYANHVNNTMRHEISSCEPIMQVARNTHAAVCKYTVDPFNGVWMAMTISLIFMIPIVILSTRLMSLYGRVDPLHNFMRQYQAAPTTATDSIVNMDSGAANDYYGLGESYSQPKPLHYYGGNTGFTNGNNYGSGMTDDYFNYQHFPPPYGGGTRR